MLKRGTRHDARCSGPAATVVSRVEHWGCRELRSLSGRAGRLNGRLGGLMTGAGISAGAGVEGVGQGGVEVEGCFECNNLAVSFKRLWDREAEDFADRTARAAGIRFEGPILASTRSLRSTAPSAGWDRSSAPGCSANSATIRTATTTPEHAGTTPVAARSPGHRNRRR